MTRIEVGGKREEACRRTRNGAVDGIQMQGEGLSMDGEDEMKDEAEDGLGVTD